MKTKEKGIAVWSISIVVAVYLILKGIQKVSPSPGMVSFFADWGYSETFLRILGVLEVLGGLLLFIPKAAFYGGVLLSGILLGATYTLLINHSAGLAEPLVFLFLSVTIIIMRFEDRLGQRV
ncbi:hypothetical protein BFP97_06075 [Roseivirga sp. 4D4]|uniref:DoxX family protein n=1 Tax=Roseivirga sp. 4D4 TaxID=1889784 RepID=UPI000853240E|nr:DoxX family protein [Roseivirga sp. 4D4]OEK01100.1 hypothetical protein BFP97_06075 [Roseivirga sp. 4D4]